MQRENWLTTSEKAYAIQKLLEMGLIKFDNKRQLPLKSGGKTDIYINLRDCRSVPGATTFLAKCFRNPILRLEPNRIVEVPASVSGIAAVLSEMVRIPYITIRETPKEGRVSKSKVIGESKYGEHVAILDDVITDGGSKIIPFRECMRMGLKIFPLIVLVDRQQGWRQNFLKHDIDADVWAGMTLHDVRRNLVETGLMERCDPRVENQNPLIVSLDGKSWEEILPIVDPLRTTGCILKVNDLMLNEGIKNIIPNLQVYGRVMADLKGHDIPNTLTNISKHLLENPPWAVTVHASGGEKMIKAVVDAFEGTRTKVLAVTVLTSFDKETCQEVYHRIPVTQVKSLAAIAEKGGADGFVCSPEEVGMLKSQYPWMTCITPGVRSVGADSGDQQRVATPAGARANGADYLVMGRQILGASDPVQEVHRLLKEELRIF